MPLFSIAIGGLILLAGLTGIAFYVSYAMVSTGEADRSGLFWYLPILYLGLGGVVAGVMLRVVGVYARRGSAVCARIGRGVVVVVPVIALLLVGLAYVSERSAQREREARMAESAELEGVVADMQQSRTFNHDWLAGQAPAEDELAAAYERAPDRR